MSTAQVSLGGSALRRYRQQAGLTQEELAERAGLSVRGIQDLERGVSRTPRRGTIDLLVAALDLPARDRARLTDASDSPAQPRTSSLQPAHRPHAAIPLLAGRSHELALLERFLAEPGDDPATAPFLLLAGEPGIGKTRLMEAAGQIALGQGWRVLAGSCRRQRGQEPYAPVLDALAAYLQAQAPDQLSTQLAGCAWLARLLPEYAEVLEPLPAGTVPGDQEQRLMFVAVRRLLANLAGSAGTLLLLDNLQWAGPEALDFLAMLLRLARPGPMAAAPLRVLGAYRDTEVGPADPLGVLLADLGRGGLAKQYTLGPLDRQEAATLLVDLLSGAEEEQSAGFEDVLERADGTPFFLVSYGTALREGSHDGIPWELALGIRQQIAQVPQAREVLGVAAIVGRQVPWVLLRAVVGQSEEVMLEALDAACRARLLLENGDDSYVFGHDLIREVVEADLGAARRAVLHRRVAETLEGMPGVSPKLLAYHYGRSDAADKALQYLEQAGGHATAQHAHRTGRANLR